MNTLNTQSARITAAPIRSASAVGSVSKGAIVAGVPQDTVTLGQDDRLMEDAMGQLFRQYRQSNSRYEQQSAKLAIEQMFDRRWGSLNESQKRLQSKMNSVFAHNNSAWVSRENLTFQKPATVKEQSEHQAQSAKSTPLTGSNFFHLDRVKKQRNLAHFSAQKRMGCAEEEVDKVMPYFEGQQRMMAQDPAKRRRLDILTSV